MNLNPRQQALKDMCKDVIDSLDDLGNGFEKAPETLMTSTHNLFAYLTRLDAESKIIHQKQKRPGFQPQWFWAFTTLMLWKLGGVEAISLDQLKAFEIDNVPDVYYDHDRKAFVMKLKESPNPDVNVFVPKKKLNKTPQVIGN